MATHQDEQLREARWQWAKKQITASAKAILDIQKRLKAIEDLIYSEEPENEEVSAGPVTYDEIEARR